MKLKIKLKKKLKDYNNEILDDDSNEDKTFENIDNINIFVIIIEKSNKFEEILFNRLFIIKFIFDINKSINIQKFEENQKKLTEFFFIKKSLSNFNTILDNYFGI